jgi:hypothetical protein
MKNLLKLILLISFLLCNFIAIAQGPGDDDGQGGNGLEGGDPGPAAQIDSQLMLLAVVGVCYAFYFYRIQIKLNSKKH